MSERKIGDWLELLTPEQRKKGYLENEDGIPIDIRIPNSYDSILPSILEVKYHKIFALEDIHEYFSDLLSDEYRICAIDGHNIDSYCDYCNTGEQGEYFCTKCRKNMCELCFSERTEEIANKNGAENWHERKESLFTCFEHEEKLQPISPILSCNICRTTSMETQGKWVMKRENGFCDLCPDCTNSEEGKQIREKGLWREKEVQNPAFATGFGSFFNWIPLLKDKDTMTTLFYNIVPDSDKYHKVALTAVDDHGREGIYIYDGTLSEILENLREKVQIYEENKREEPNWDDHYGCPIHLLLLDAGKKIYFG